MANANGSGIPNDILGTVRDLARLEQVEDQRLGRGLSMTGN